MLVKSSELKYFLYISKAKLDMLHQQVAQSDGAKRTVEWKLDAKLASVTAKRETQKPIGDKEQYDKLKAVLARIEESGEVGTVDEPKSYFKGTLPMKWGMYRDFGRPEGEPPLVYFGGKTRKTIFGLGGSTRHVLGFEGATATSSRSSTPYLVAHLLEGIGISSEGWDAFNAEYRDAFEAVLWATHNLHGPDQTLEFFAKTLLKGHAQEPIITKGKRKQCVLGTPLYVSLEKMHEPSKMWYR
jgi:hypothetical protein